MNTPVHLIMGAAAFGRRGDARVTWAAILGALAPDVSLYLLAGGALFLFGIPAQQVFGQLYYSDAWQQVFAIDNSFILWGIGMTFALWRKSAVAVAFTAAALLHLAFDFPLHTHDARMHFWPVSDWKFISPFSYWDRAQGGGAVGWVELGIAVILSAVLVRRHVHPWARAGFAALALVQIAPNLFWRLVF